MKNSFGKLKSDEIYPNRIIHRVYRDVLQFGTVSLGARLQNAGQIRVRIG